MSLHESTRRLFGLPLIGIDAFTAIKGERVFRDGKVHWVTDDIGKDSGDAIGGRVRAHGPWHLEAAVAGSNGETYSTTIALDRTSASLRARSDCTCPMAHQCKHGAAALIAWLQARDGSGSAAVGRGSGPAYAGVLVPDRRSDAGVDAGAASGGPPALNGKAAGPARLAGSARQEQHHEPDASGRFAAQQRSRALFQRQHALHWARDLNSVRIPGSRSETDRPHLCYVLQIQDRIARLSVFRIRGLKDGQYSRPERYLSLCEEALKPPAFWDDVDATVALSMLQEERSTTFGHALAGPRAREALLALANTGRLFLDEPPRARGDAAIRPGPPLPARVAWLLQSPADDPAEGAGPPLRLGLRVTSTLASPAMPIYCAPPCYLDRAAGVLGPLELEEPIPASVMQWLRDAPTVAPEAAPEVALVLHAAYLARPALRGRIPDYPQQQVRESKEPPRFVMGLFTTGSTPARDRPRAARGGRSFLAVSLAVEYAGQRTEPLRLATMGVQTDTGPVLVVCDRPAERAALKMLAEAVSAIAQDEPALSLAPEPGPGNSAGGSGSSGWLTVAALPADGIAAARIKHEFAGTLREAGWLIVDHSELPTVLVSAQEVVVDLRRADKVAGERHASDWFQLQSGIQVGNRRIDLAPLLAGILAMGGFDAWRSARCPDGVLWMKASDTEVLRLDAGRIEPLARVVADWAQLRDGMPGQPEARGEPAFLVSRFAAAQLAGALGGISLPESVQRLRDWFDAFQGLQAAQAPPSFHAALRPYQRDGLAWLQFLAGAGLGGILADDMGLGKTIQVLAHVDLERSAGRLVDPVLVVAPTSVIFNWQAEAARHAPGLRVLALTGAGRSRHFDDLAGHDLVLTSYALLPRDAAVLCRQHWHAVILDEAQMIKNPRTHGAIAVRELAANHRLALTGTPLENHLGELWSIMSFVLPGLLGPEEAFRSRFRTPIEKHPGSETAAARLRALEGRIRPFMLRRTKQAVLADLPPRTEIIQRVELPTEQRDLYESIRAAMDKRVRNALSRAGLAKSQIVLLDALLKLRQACCDPALVRLPGARRVTRSAKRDALIELLATLVDEGRKALVFSQFTSMLDLIESAIDADPRLADVPRTRLDGDTIDRGGAVAQFQQGDAQLFLLSLKAGGVGLNLTAADTVIHYDPWWNPAVENQATDRAHRIGQEKPVFVHKLIAAGTVEERILALQARKAELAEAVLSGTLTAGGKALSQEDLLGLFEPL